MITIPEYLQLLESKSPNKSGVDGYVKHCFPTAQEINNLRELIEDFMFDPAEGREGLVEIYPLAEAKAAFDRPNFKAYNWHYDRLTQHVIMNLRKGAHEYLCGALWICSHPEVGDKFFGMKEQENNAEKFIEEGLGWFRSSSSFGRALKGKDVKLTPQEKVVFGSMFMDM